jgi:hypothetical protein
VRRAITVFGAAFFVALAAAAFSLWALVAAGKTDGRENLVLVILVTFALAFAVAVGLTKRLQLAAAVAGLATLFIVGGGFLALYALYAHWCGSDPSAC